MANRNSLLLSPLCSKTLIVVLTILWTGALFYLQSFHFATPASIRHQQVTRIINQITSIKMKNDAEDKWARYTDRSTLPERLTLMGDLEACKGDAMCNSYQKLHDANELLHLPPDIQCDQIRMVGTGDPPMVNGQGPYRVCFDRPFRPIHGKCLIYSFGIADDWSFDDTMAGQMGCNVFSFDPTIGKAEHKRSERIHFYPWGISQTDQKTQSGMEMKTLSSIHKQLGHENKTIDILKIDAEGAEIPCFQQLINEGFLQKFVKQILVEWHPGADTASQGGLEFALAPYYRLRHEAGFRAYYIEPRFLDDSMLLVESLVNTKFSPQ